jgi:hypothetical protein
MAPPVPARASKQRILDLLTVALGATPLRDMGLDAIRSVLGANPRIAVLDGAFDLEPVWELLESQEGFDADVAKPPFALVKSLEGRLGVVVKLPRALEGLAPSDIVRFAALSSVKRDEVDKLVLAVTVEELDTAPRPQSSGKPHHFTAPEPAAPQSPKRRKTVLAVAGSVVALSLVWLGVFIATQTTGAPDSKTLAEAHLGGLPVADARRWREEVRATLTDTAWLARPEPARREQMSQAFARLSRNGVAALVVVDGQNRIRASAQQGKSGPVVKFY